MLKCVEGFSGLYIYEPKVFEDERGYFFESYSQNEFEKNGVIFNIVQQNRSKSKKGTVRGLHYQSGEYQQAKFIRVIHGEILDVAVDLRVSSNTFGKYFSIILSNENKKGLYIPAGFAHGFVALSEDVEIIYDCDNFYNKDSEGGILYSDPELNIDWMVSSDIISLSEKDKNQNLLKDYINKPDFL